MQLSGAVYKVNNRGPNTKPWGTPQSRLLEAETVSEVIIDWFNLTYMTSTSFNTSWKAESWRESFGKLQMINDVKSSRQVQQTKSSWLSLWKIKMNVIFEFKKCSFNRVAWFVGQLMNVIHFIFRDRCDLSCLATTSSVNLDIKLSLVTGL